MDGTAMWRSQSMAGCPSGAGPAMVTLSLVETPAIPRLLGIGLDPVPASCFLPAARDLAGSNTTDPERSVKCMGSAPELQRQYAHPMGDQRSDGMGMSSIRVAA